MKTITPKIHISFILLVVFMILISSCSKERVATNEEIAQPASQANISLQECPTSDILRSQEQISIAGILPGITTETELKELLGEPTRFTALDVVQKEYIYDSFLTTSDGISTTYHVYVRRDTVHSLVVNVLDYDKPVTSEEVPDKTVLEVIQTYGCPDFIYLQSFGEHIIPGVYHGGYLVYLTEGLEFQFSGLPLSTDTTIDFTTYFTPMSQIEYIENLRYGDSKDLQRVLTWGEATIWKNEQQ